MKRIFLALVSAVSLSLVMASVSTGANAVHQSVEGQAKPFRDSWFFRADPENVGIQQNWHKTVKPDASWTVIKSGRTWESQGFDKYDGIGWYWNTISVPRNWGRIHLYLPAVDDAYTLYVNGTEIARDGHPGRKLYNWATSHEITQAVVNCDTLMVVLRVEDYGLDGGLVYGPAEIRNYSGSIDITQDWRFSTDPQNQGLTKNWHEKDFSDRDWPLIACGASWESLGYDYDGYAWYRKQVTIPDQWQARLIFLELSDVDDYLDVYIDGNHIGHEGTPHQPLWGRTTRLNLTGHVQPGQTHLICLRVEDVGQPGGIKGSPCTLSAQLPICEIDVPRNYDYLFQTPHPGAPKIAPYSCQTGLEHYAFKGLAPKLRQGKDVTWAIAKGPHGLTIDPQSGQLAWSNPILGPGPVQNLVQVWDWRVVIMAQNNYGHDYAAFTLKVLSSDGPPLHMVRTKYIDWVVSQDIAKWFTAVKPHTVIDKQWEMLRDVIGFEPDNGRQVIKYQYDLGGAAWSGNPVRVGPSLWSSDRVGGWSLGIWLHEVGHNFNGQTLMHEYSNNGFYGEIYHHFCEFTSQLVQLTTLQYPEQFSLHGAACQSFRDFMQGLKKDWSRRYEPFGEWIKTHDDISTYQGDRYGIWMGVLSDLADRYGHAFFEKCIRAMRCDGLSLDLRRKADTMEKMNALIAAIMSCSAKADLLDYFKERKFGIDETFYRQHYRTVEETINNLPHEDNCGWKYNATAKKYYRRTPMPMTWYEAELFAQSLGGHLVRIANSDELNWLSNRFGKYPELWVGFYRDSQTSTWTSFGGQPNVLAWRPGYPLAAPDYRFAVFHTETKTFTTEKESVCLMGIVEVEKIPDCDCPGIILD